MDNNWRNQVIALAGIVQALSTMDELARTGYLQTAAFDTAVNSLLDLDPASTEAVFGSVNNLQPGIDALIELLSNPRHPKLTSIASYCLGVFHLQKRFVKNPKMVRTVGEGLEKAQHQVRHFGTTHDNVIANLAGIYQSTISTFPFRIQVVGEHQYLQQQRVANQVRVLLLAAIRAATLWQQTGGRRWKLLWYKSKLLTAAESLKLETTASLDVDKDNDDRF